MTNQARLEDEAGNRDLAESLYRAALAMRRDLLLREALSIRRESAPANDWRVALTENDLGACLLARGKRDKGAALIEGSLGGILAQRGDADPRARIAGSERGFAPDTA